MVCAHRHLRLSNEVISVQGQSSFAVSAATVWNALPLTVRDPSLTLMRLTQFCARMKTVLFCRAYKTLPQRIR